MEKTKETKTNRGITLIALVITIIVLLILAGVAINLTLGDNGIFTKAKEAKKETMKAQALEEVNIAVSGLIIKENTSQMSQEEKRADLEAQLKQVQANSTVTINGTGFIVNHRGYEVKIDDKYGINIKEPFVAEEWDKLAATEDCFQWGSDTPGEEGYDVIIGYTEKAQSYTKLRIPSRCKSITCDGSFHEENPRYDTTIGRAFIANVKEIEIPSTVVEIGEYAFSMGNSGVSSSLEKILIPDSVTSIGSYAFYDCTSLTDIIIPNSITSIGHSAFDTCTSLTKITIPHGVQIIEGMAFYGCTSLTEITIPNSVASIGYSAFARCTSLTEITIPNSVTSIGGSAFENCESLEEITIPNKVTCIDNFAFRGCASLAEITISNNLVELGSDVFGNTKWYTNQPDGEMYLGNVFYGYKGTMPENTVINIKEGTRIIADLAFHNCTSLTEVIIPTGVANFGRYAFSGCTSLTEVIIPNGVTSIESYAFSRCASLTNITIPSSVISMGESVFEGCNITVKCRAGSAPDGWEYRWDRKNYKGETVNVVWGYAGE